jgi:hypothetical protein
MATANIQLPDGTKVSIEGSPEEVARLLALYGSKEPAGDQPRNKRPKRASSITRAGSGAAPHLHNLIVENYFSERRSLADVQHRLEELGHIFPLSHLSTPLRRLVVGRELRRLREGKNWVYVRS